MATDLKLRRVVIDLPKGKPATLTAVRVVEFSANGQEFEVDADVITLEFDTDGDIFSAINAEIDAVQFAQEGVNNA